KEVALATLQPDLKGMVAANVDVHRRSGRWSGGGHVVAKELQIPKQPTVDIDANLEIKGRHVTADAPTIADAGAGRLPFGVDGPYDLTDVLAWKRLDRRAIDVAGIGVSKLDLAKLGKGKLPGVVDGKLGVTAKDASGVLHITGVQTTAGT